MIAILRLAVADSRARWPLLVGAALLVAAPVTGFLLLDGLTRTIDRAFRATGGGDLIVEESNSVGEFLGSRIPASVGEDLLDLGEPFAIPEIHTVTGTAADTAILLRGVDLARYRAVTGFEMVSGRPLAPGDPARSAMVGSDFAARRALAVGDSFPIRGRPFTVAGVFTIGTYADHEAWASLDDAREVLGWGDEVSVFVIPASGPLAEGDVIAGPLSVVARGDFAAVNDEWDPIIGLTTVATGALAIAAAVVLAAVLWRLAWLRRRDLAIMRAIGLGRWVPGAFLTMQGAVVAVLGLGGGIVVALLAARFVVIEAFGISGHPEFDPIGILRSAAVGTAIVAVALGASAAATMRARPAALLRRW